MFGPSEKQRAPRGGLKLSFEEDLSQLPLGQTEAQLGEAQDRAGRQSGPPLATTKYPPAPQCPYKVVG